MEVSIFKLIALLFLPLICKFMLLFSEIEDSYSVNLKVVVVQLFSLFLYYLSEISVISVLYFITDEWLFCKGNNTLDALFITYILIVIIFSVIYAVCLYNSDYVGGDDLVHCVIFFVICTIFLILACFYAKNTSKETIEQNTQVEIQTEIYTEQN